MKLKELIRKLQVIEKKKPGRDVQFQIGTALNPEISQDDAFLAETCTSEAQLCRIVVVAGKDKAALYKELRRAEIEQDRKLGLR